MIRYAYSCSGMHRKGAFGFISANQSHWHHSRKVVEKAVESEIYEVMHQYDPPMSREKALEEIGAITIYELSVTTLETK